MNAYNATPSLWLGNVFLCYLLLYFELLSLLLLVYCVLFSFLGIYAGYRARITGIATDVMLFVTNEQIYVLDSQENYIYKYTYI